jgi:hypothetical protein
VQLMEDYAKVGPLYKLNPVVTHSLKECLCEIAKLANKAEMKEMKESAWPPGDPTLEPIK